MGDNQRDFLPTQGASRATGLFVEIVSVSLVRAARSASRMDNLVIAFSACEIREARLQGDPSARGLGLVAFNFECSSACPILPGLMGGSLAEVTGQPYKMMERTNQSQRGDRAHCTFVGSNTRLRRDRKPICRRGG